MGGVARAIVSPLSLIDKDLGKLGLQVVAAVAPAFGPVGAAISIGATVALATLYKPKSPTIAPAALDRLNASLVPAASRKMLFGRTALATDIRHAEPSGTDQEYVDYIIHLASHRISSVDELWIEDRLAWSAAFGAQGIHAGYLTVTPILEGGPGAVHVVNGGAKWGAAQRLTGCASLRLRIKRTGNSKKAESPFANGLSGRLTILGAGMPLYDPRRDDTVPGGAGPMRFDDQATWAFSDEGYELGQNHALQALAYLRGWTINGRVSVGCGYPRARLDLASFAVAANACDEAIALAAGGFQRRYEGGGIATDEDDRAAVMAAFAAATNGWFDDSTGKLGMFVAVNDLAGPLVALTDDDVLSGFRWSPFPAAPINIVRGVCPEPSAPSLFTPTDYPAVELPAVDGIDRTMPLDLGLVQDKRRAQRIAKQVLQRQQYQGTFTATFGVRAWQLRVGQPVRLSFSALGWANQLLRVMSWRVTADATVEMTLRIEHPSIYAWQTEESAAVTAAEPTRYDPLNAPFIRAIAAAATTADWPNVTDPDGTKPQDNATVGMTPEEAAALLAAQNRIAAIASDAVLSAGSEKSQAILDWTANGDDFTALYARFQALGSPADIEPAAALAASKVGALNAYLADLDQGGLYPEWSDLSGDTPIVAATWRATWGEALAAVAQFRAAITGRKGDPGASGYAAILTNESHTLPAASDGTVLTYDGAGGSFQVLYGADFVASDFTLGIAANPQALTVAIDGMSFTVTGGLGTGEPAGYLLLRATGAGQHAGVVIDKVFSLAKSLAAADGASPALVRIGVSDQAIKYNGLDEIVTGNVIVTVATQNTGSVPLLRFIRPDGTDQVAARTIPQLIIDFPDAFAPSGPDALFVYQSYLNQLMQNFGSIRIEASVPGGVSDVVTLVKVKDGAEGSSGQSGESPVIRYAHSSEQPGTPVSGVYGRDVPGWYESPPGSPAPLWQIVANFRGDVQLTDWSTPVRVTGPDGGVGSVSAGASTFDEGGGQPEITGIFLAAGSTVLVRAYHAAGQFYHASGSYPRSMRIDLFARRKGSGSWELIAQGATELGYFDQEVYLSAETYYFNGGEPGIFEFRATSDIPTYNFILNDYFTVGIN